MNTRSMQRRSQRGFSLIELLIVVAIIGIIAGIAIPNYLHAQQAAKASSAVNSLRIIHTSQISFRTLYGSYADFATLGSRNYFTDTQLKAGQKSGYQFVVTLDADPVEGYSATATPTYSGVWHHYFIDTTGVLRYAVGAVATAASPAIQ